MSILSADIKRLAIALIVTAVAGCAAAPANAPPADTAAATTAATPVPIALDPRYLPQPYVHIRHPEWTRDAVIYQINTRQFTAEGTFRAAIGELPRLHELGVDILWLMPIHPIGEKNRKGTLGSPYSVRDYRAVNPELGTLDDLRAFVDAAHALKMHVILDWVANHSAWDNPLLAGHPDWYKRDSYGQPHPTAWWDWSDIIEFDYNQPGLRAYMPEAMKYWVRDVGIDGYRCDVAGFVPLDFWNNVRRELDEIRPVFLLAEWESRDLHADAFDATYAWSWWDHVRNIAQGKADVFALHGYYAWNENFFPPDAQRMTFVSNHDKNSWEGTEFENFAAALPAAMVLSVVGEGMPMIYNGQEAGNERRLQFFEKDPIQWRAHPNGALYQQLIALKSKHSALWNAPWGARMAHVPNTTPAKVFSFVRENARDKILAVFNFSADRQTVGFEQDLFPGRYRDAFNGTEQELDANTRLSIEPWGYRVWVRTRNR